MYGGGFSTYGATLAFILCFVCVHLMKKILLILSALFWFSLTPDRKHLAYVSSQATCISVIHFVLALYI